MMKKILIGAVALVVVIAGGLFYVWSNLDEIVKTAIETYGSETTHTPVKVATVKLDLKNGKAQITGLTVGNPKGFSDPNIFELGSISTSIDLSTLQQNPIVIDEIHIAAPKVVYEIDKAGTSNADEIKKNLGVGGSSGGSGDSGKSEAASSGGKDELKMIIRKLVVEGSSATVRVAALGHANNVKLPRIVMTDIGKKSGGATAAEVASQVSGKLLGNLQNSVASIGVDKYLGKSADAIKQQMQGAGGVADKIGNEAGGALKGLLGQ